MKHYERMLDMGCFSPAELARELRMGLPSVYSLLRDYMRKGYLLQVRRNLYAAISLESKAPASSPYQIASRITPTSYLCCHSALAYHGYRNQVSHEVYVASESKFSDFEFEGMDYRYLASRGDFLILESQGVRATTIERSVIDSLDRFDRVGGFEELIKALEIIPYLDEGPLLECLSRYDKAFLYQKTGFVLEHFARELHLSESFIGECLAKKGGSVRYLSSATPRANQTYDPRWGLMVPKDIWHLVE